MAVSRRKRDLLCLVKTLRRVLKLEKEKKIWQQTQVEEAREHQRWAERCCELQNRIEGLQQRVAWMQADVDNDESNKRSQGWAARCEALEDANKFLQDKVQRLTNLINAPLQRFAERCMALENANKRLQDQVEWMTQGFRA